MFMFRAVAYLCPGSQRFADGIVDLQVGVRVAARFAFVDKYQLIALVVINESGGGIYGEGRSTDDEHVGVFYVGN